MNIRAKSQISYKDSDSNNDFKDAAIDMYRMNTSEALKYLRPEVQKTLETMRRRVSLYCTDFDKTFKNLNLDDTFMYQMKRALDPSKKDREKSEENIILTQKDLNKRMSSLNSAISIMDRGYNLLHEIRYQLTNQKIETEFSVNIDKKIYRIPESALKNKKYFSKTLSVYGGGTTSNPFSLAYKLDLKEMAKDTVLLKEYCQEEMNVANFDISKKIYELKKPYLDWKSSQTGRIYSNIYFDGKDMEIIDLAIQTIEAKKAFNIELADYIDYRKKMGGGGGYKTPFYKLGDVGLKQDKYFAISGGGRTSTVNFARFSLLRDRFRQLNNILHSQYYGDVVSGLSEFFTENEKNVSDEISKRINREAKEFIKNLLLPDNT